MRVAGCGIIAASILMAGCSDEITVNSECFYPTGSQGGIVGWVSPVDAGSVTATGAAGTAQAWINEDGYFILDTISPGVYSLTVAPENFSHRKFFDLLVNPGDINSQGEITLSTCPYPIYRISPEDGTEISHSKYLSLYVDEPLSIEDLEGATTIEPPAVGTWSEEPGRLIYRFSEKLMIATTYQVTIDASVTTAAGEPLGADLQFSFTTQPLSVSIHIYRGGLKDKVSVSEFRAALSFNTYIDCEAVSQAAVFEPDITGIWIPQDDYFSPYGPRVASFFTFLPYGGSLDYETSYTLTISDQVDMGDGMRLQEPETIAFETEGIGVFYVNPHNGESSVPPDDSIRMEFNVAMEPVSVESAFSLQEVPGDLVEGSFEWYSTKRVYFRPAENLHSGSLYRISLSTEARTSEGVNISEPFESHFCVE